MKHQKTVVLIIYIILGILVFYNSLNGDFVWDDLSQVVKNSKVHSLDKIPGLMVKSAIESDDGQQMIHYKPLMFVVYNLIWNLAGDTPVYFKTFQLIFHIFNSFLVFLIMARFYRKELAFFCGLIFLVHPISSEVVQYVADLQDVMFMFFGLAGFLYLINSKGKDGCYWQINVSVFFSLLLSLGFKGSGLLFVLILFLYKLLLSRDRLVHFSVMLFSSLVTYLCMRFFVASIIGIEMGRYVLIVGADSFTRLLTVPKIIYYYFSNLLFPYSITVGQHWVVESITSISFIIPFILLIVVISIIVYFRKRIFQDSLLMFWLCWVVIGLGLHIHIIPLDFTVATRWFYFPFLGVLGVCAHLLDKRVINFKAFNIFATTIVIILSVRTFVRNTNWKDEYTLYKHDLKERGMEGSYDLHNNLGKILYTSGMRQEGCDHFKKSTEASPLWWVSWNNLGLCYEREGRYDLAEQQYKASIKNGDYLFGYINYISMLLKTKRVDKAIRVASIGSKLFPENMFFKRVLKFKN